MTDIRARLQADLAATRSRLHALAPVDREGPTDSGGGPDLDGDAAMAAINQAEALGARERLLIQERALVRAIQRCDAGTHGVCAACDGPIGDQRLAALPTTEVCIECARDQERRAARALAGRWDDEEET